MDKTLIIKNKNEQELTQESHEILKVSLANAAVLDNVSILEVKLARILNNRNNVESELGEYVPLREKLLSDYPEIKPFYERLSELHALLWDIEDTKRQIEKGKNEEEFVTDILSSDPGILKEYLILCRQVSKYNDERASIKKQINIITGSRIIEEKSHQTVKGSNV